MKKNHDYWHRRAIRLEREWHKRCQETVEKQLAHHYQAALYEIKNDILQLYATFAKDNGLDFNEAKQMLSSREFREWRMSVSEYLAANDAGLTRELNTLGQCVRESTDWKSFTPKRFKSSISLGVTSMTTCENHH